MARGSGSIICREKRWRLGSKNESNDTNNKGRIDEPQANYPHKRAARIGLDRIDIPCHEWLYSEEMDEVYHYDQGVFKTHAVIQHSASVSILDEEFYAHHSLKVPDKNAFLVRVSKGEDGRLKIEEVIDKSPFGWEPITSQKSIESKTLQRNKRHLQQVAMEEGLSTQDPIRQFVSAEGMEEVRQILDGKYQVMDLTTNEPTEINNTLATWMSQLKQTEKEMHMKETVGSISPAELQEAFQKAKEKTASNGDLHFTVWKAMVADDEFVEWLAIMISIPGTHQTRYFEDQWSRDVAGDVGPLG